MFRLTDSTTQQYLFASDFDKTLSFNDSGLVLSEIIGVTDFDEKVSGLAHTNLVQQGAELAYLLRHDPEYRRVRRDDLAEVGDVGAPTRCEVVDGHHLITAGQEQIGDV